MAESPNDFRSFEKMFRAIRSQNAEARKDAVGLLTPSLIQKHINAGTGVTLPYGKKGDTVSFTIDELKDFQQSLKKVKAKNRASIAGLPLLALERASAAEDKMLMRQQIRSAVLYKISGNLLTFRVSASGQTLSKYYQVRVRLEQWSDLMTDSRTWLSGARAAAVGNISFDCGCGRHQFWYRYLATMSNCAISPKEKDFPKIRNPRLTGFCCKHTLKAFQQLKSGSVHKLLAKEMERQAEKIGYMTPASGKFLNKKDLAAMDRARGSDKELDAAKKAYQDFRAARKSFKKKLQEPKTVSKRKEMEKKLIDSESKLKVKAAEAKAQKARAQKAERELSDARSREQQLQKDALVGQIGMFVMRSQFQQGRTREEAISDFAAQNNISIKEVDDMAKGAGV